MQYLCLKQLTAGGKTYYPGQVIPEGVILPGRAAVLKKMGYISEACAGEQLFQPSGKGKVLFHTQEELDSLLDEAAKEAVNNMVRETCMYEGTVAISVKEKTSGGDEQVTEVRALPGEIQNVFSIMQMNAEDGVKAVAGVKSKNVLILLYAADSRKTVKNAAKEQADKLFSTEGISNELTGIDAGGADV